MSVLCENPHANHPNDERRTPHEQNIRSKPLHTERDKAALQDKLTLKAAGSTEP